MSFPILSKYHNLLSNLKIEISSPEEAMPTIRSGDRIFIGTASATPRQWVAHLEAYHQRKISDLQIFHFLTDGAIAMEDRKPATRFKHLVFFVGRDSREAVKSGLADCIPISVAQIPGLFKSGRFPIDVAMIQVSLPDTHGYVSLGVSVDITSAGVKHAKTVIAEINPNMPQVSA